MESETHKSSRAECLCSYAMSLILNIHANMHTGKSATSARTIREHFYIITGWGGGGGYNKILLIPAFLLSSSLNFKKAASVFP